MAITRQVHVVRVKNKGATKDNFVFADVKVIDKVAVKTSNGQEMLYDFSAVNAIPFITDKTGHGNAKGNAQTASRASHMKTLGDPSSGSYMDVEILDAVVTVGPNGQEIAWIVPEAASTALVTDSTGNGLAAKPQSATRSDHIVMLIPGPPVGPPQQNSGVDAGQLQEAVSISTDDPNWLEELADVPPITKTTERLIVERVDAVALQAPTMPSTATVNPKSNNDIDDLDNPDSNIQMGNLGLELLIPQLMVTQNNAEHDTTVYGTDAFGLQVPPDNTDPNLYVYLPETISSPPYLGNDPTNVAKQGPLWWITKIGAVSTGKASIVPYTIQLTIDFGVSGETFDQLDDNYWMTLGEWDNGKTPGVDSPSKTDTVAYLRLGDVGPSGNNAFSLELGGVVGQIALLIWAQSPFAQLNVWHANFTATQDADPGLSCASAISPNVGMNIPTVGPRQEPVYALGDLGVIGGLPPGDTHTYSLQIVTLGANFGSPPGLPGFGAVGQASNPVGVNSPTP